MSNLALPENQVPAPRPNRLPWYGLIIVVLLFGGSVAVVIFNRPRIDPLAEGITEVVTAQPITLRIRASGSIVPIQSVNISPKQAGRLAELLVDQGDRVTQGQIIARMDDSSVVPQVLQSRASVASAQANLVRLQNGSRTEDINSARARVASAQARLELATSKVQRNQLLADQGAISRDRLEEFKTEQRTAQASLRETQQQLAQLENGSRIEDIAQAEAQLLQAEASLRSAEVQLEDTIIRSPLTGIVAQKYATAGAFVAPQVSASATNSATSASIVAIANGLEILARVPEVDISQIKQGQTVEITADAFPNQSFRGRVRLIAPEAILEQNVTSFQIRITLETGLDILRSGMNTDLRFLGTTIDQAITVPTVAVVTRDGQTGVLLVDQNNRPEFRPITLGITVGDRTQVLAGVNAGDRIFLSNPSRSNQ